jgi:nucleoside-diphosphate-sugar epimerase
MSIERRAVVLGATGHLGRAAVQELLARGYAVTAATRQRNAPSLEGLGATVSTGDIDCPGQLDSWVTGNHVVIDAAAPHPLSVCVPDRAEYRDPMRYAEVRTRALLDAVTRHRARLVFVSSFTTLPRHDVGFAAAEAMWRRTVYPYFRVKEMMEATVLRAAAAGVEAVVVNPGAFLGPWENKPVDESFVRMVLGQRLTGTIQQVINVIDVRDVAAALCSALDAERYGVQIPLAGHNIMMSDLALRVAREGGVVPPRVGLNARIAALAAFCGEMAWATAGRSAPHALRAVPLIADAVAMSAGGIQRELGACVRPLDDTIRDSVQWILHGSVT